MILFYKDKACRKWKKRQFIVCFFHFSMYKYLMKIIDSKQAIGEYCLLKKSDNIISCVGDA